MTAAIVLLMMWSMLVLGTGSLINYLFGMTSIPIIINASGIVVLILEIIGILIGVIIFLIYVWSCKQTVKIERTVRNIKTKTKNKIDKMGKEQNDRVNEHKENVKNWYNDQWFAIEDTNDNN